MRRRCSISQRRMSTIPTLTRSGIEIETRPHSHHWRGLQSSIKAMPDGMPIPGPPLIVNCHGHHPLDGDWCRLKRQRPFQLYVGLRSSDVDHPLDAGSDRGAD